MVVIPEIPLSLPTNQKRVHRLHPSPQVVPFKNPSPKAFGEVSLGLLSMSYPFSLLGASNKHFQSPLSGVSKLALQNGGGTEPSSLGDASSPLTTHSPSPLSGLNTRERCIFKIFKLSKCPLASYPTPFKK